MIHVTVTIMRYSCDIFDNASRKPQSSTNFNVLLSLFECQQDSILVKYVFITLNDIILQFNSVCNSLKPSVWTCVGFFDSSPSSSTLLEKG